MAKSLCLQTAIRRGTVLIPDPTSHAGHFLLVSGRKAINPQQSLSRASPLNDDQKFRPSENLASLDSSPTYYQSVLQNLFFGTLNMPPELRSFREKKKDGQRFDGNRGSKNLWRYAINFQDYDERQNLSANWLAIAKLIPFLNGGLFDCLDLQYTKKENRANVILGRIL